MWVAWDDDEYWMEPKPTPTSCAPKRAAALIALEHRHLLAQRRIWNEVTEDRFGLLAFLHVLP